MAEPDTSSQTPGSNASPGGRIIYGYYASENYLIPPTLFFTSHYGTPAELPADLGRNVESTILLNKPFAATSQRACRYY